jgi:hypothetical protein
MDRGQNGDKIQRLQYRTLECGHRVPHIATISYDSETGHVSWDRYVYCRGCEKIDIIPYEEALPPKEDVDDLPAPRAGEGECVPCGGTGREGGYSQRDDCPYCRGTGKAPTSCKTG